MQKKLLCCQLIDNGFSDFIEKIDMAVTKTMTKSLVKNKSKAKGIEFLKTELGRYVLEEADASIPIEKVREVLSAIKGNWAQDIIADRDERY